MTICSSTSPLFYCSHIMICLNYKCYYILIFTYITVPLLCFPQTGVVQVNRRLDRERLAEYRLTITVKDNPENPRIARRVCVYICV